MRCALIAVLLAVSAAPGAAAHEAERDWRPDRSGPRLGFPATSALSAAPVQSQEGFKSAYLRLRGATSAPPTGRAHVAAADARTTYVRTGFTGVEPTLGVDKAGNVFFVAIGGGAQGPAVIVRSRDGGATWEEAAPVTPAGNPPSFDPFVHVDRDTGRVFNADLSLVACSIVSTSDDQGDTWQPGKICQHTDHQNLFTGPPVSSSPIGYPNVVYYCAIDGGAFFNFGTFTGCSKSLDGGRTFVRTGQPPFTEDPTRTGGHYGVRGHCGGNVAHGTVGRDGTVYLPRGFCDRPYLAISHDEGANWERVQVADLGVAVGPSLEEHEASVAVDRDGNLYYAWIAVDRLPYLVTSRDGGRTWTKPVRMSAADVNEAWNVILDVGDPGRIAFSYVGTTNSPGGPFCARTTATGCVKEDGSPFTGEYEETTWHAYVGTSYDALAAAPSLESAPANDPVTPIMRGGPCGPSRCSIQLDFLDLDVADDGTAWAIFVDGLCDPDPEAGCSGSEAAVVHLHPPKPLVGTILDQAPPVVTTPAPAPTQARKPSCLKGRRLVVRAKRQERGHVRSFRVTVNGKRVRVRRGRAVVDLRRYRGRTIVVRTVTRTTARRSFRAQRRYRVC